MIQRCPACHSKEPAPASRAAVAALAAQWQADPACTVPPEILDRHLADLFGGAEWVEMLRCPACGLEQASPAVSWTAEAYPRHPHYLAFDHHCALDRLRRMKPGRLLELGCGDGLFLAEAAALGFQAVGLDFDAQAVARARARGLDARVGEASALGEGLGVDARFDAIAMFQILEHVPDPDRLLKDLAPLAAPGGVLMIGVPAPNRFGRVVGHQGQVAGSDYWDWPPQHVLRWTGSAFRQILPRHGWRLDELREEPLSLLGAAATLTAIDGGRAGWYGNPVRRRIGTLRRLVRVARARLARPVSGTRMFALATRD